MADDPPLTESGGSGNTGFSATFGGTTPSGPSTGNYDVKTSLPEAIVRHEISDEQLTMLHNGQEDRAFQIMLAAIGVAVGALPQVMRDVSSAFFAEKQVPLDGISAIVIAMCAGAAAVAVVCFILARRGQSAIDILVKDIRDRTNFRIHGVKAPSKPKGTS